MTILDYAKSGVPRVPEMPARSWRWTVPNARADGIWSDGTTMWVVDRTGRRMYAYTLATGARDTSKEWTLPSAPITTPREYGRTALPCGWWIGQIDTCTPTHWRRERETPSKEWTLPSENNNPSGIWSDGTTMWVAESRTATMIRLHTGDGGARHRARSGRCLRRITTPRESGLTVLPCGFSTPRTTNCTPTTGSTGARVSAQDIDLTAANSNPRWIWSDGATMWVVDYSLG